MKSSFLKILSVIIFGFLVASCSKEADSTGSNTALVDGSNGGSTGQGGSLAKFTIVGNYMYAISSHYLYVFDITNPSNPLQINQNDFGFDMETIYPFNNNLFIGTKTGLFIYSLATPSAPVKIGEAQHARSCDPVVANDSMAFVTLKGNSFCGPAVSGLYVHDIRNILQPQLITTVPITNPEGLGLKGNSLYICCNADGLKVFDVSHPDHPVEIRTITGAYFKDVIPYGDLLICYVSDGIMLYDISNPTDPVELKLITNT